MEKKRYTLSLLVDNIAGVVSLVSRLFSRKGYNIESLSGGVTEDPTISRITIEVLCDSDEKAEFIVNQLRKLIPVHSVKILDGQHSIRRELMLLKISTPTADARSEVIQISNIFRANIIDVAETSTTIAVIGEEEKLEAIERLVSKHKILEMVRTGAVALERGSFTMRDDSKETEEFNIGKNVN